MRSCPEGLLGCNFNCTILASLQEWCHRYCSPSQSIGAEFISPNGVLWRPGAETNVFPKEFQWFWTPSLLRIYWNDECNWFPQSLADFRGIPWKFIGFYGIPCDFVGFAKFHGIWWNSVSCNVILRFMWSGSSWASQNHQYSYRNIKVSSTGPQEPIELFTSSYLQDFR